MSGILIIDDDRALTRSLSLQLEALGHTVATSDNSAEGIHKAKGEEFDLILLDLRLPKTSGLEVLKQLKELGCTSPIVMISGEQDMKATIEAMRIGAFDYIRKPFTLDEVILALEKTGREKSIRPSLFRPKAEILHPREIVGRHPAITEVVKKIGLLSRSRVTVLIAGESGTGKELVARALHEATSRDEPFVAINCSAVVETLLESELFGHEKGAFTGADSVRIGKLEHAASGTVFLDEIGDMAPGLQAKLLRALQELEFERIGGNRRIPFSARVVAATNRDLLKMVENGLFRKDLYYRLAVTVLRLPPLRERLEDIPLLVNHLATQIAVRLGVKSVEIAPSFFKLLYQNDWRGNVRELENILTRAIALSQNGILSDADISFAGSEQDASDAASVPLRLVEREHIYRVLRGNEWNITATARVLEISPTTLRKKISDYGLKR